MANGLPLTAAVDTVFLAIDLPAFLPGKRHEIPAHQYPIRPVQHHMTRNLTVAWPDYIMHAQPPPKSGTSTESGTLRSILRTQYRVFTHNPDCLEIGMLCHLQTGYVLCTACKRPGVSTM